MSELNYNNCADLKSTNGLTYSVMVRHIAVLKRSFSNLTVDKFPILPHSRGILRNISFKDHIQAQFQQLNSIATKRKTALLYVEVTQVLCKINTSLTCVDYFT